MDAMDGRSRGTLPLWFWVVAGLLTLWGLFGCLAAYMQITKGAEAMGPSTQYDRDLFASLPGWYLWTYATAVGAGTLGGITLLLRSRLAQPLFLVSLIAVIVQFGWVFGMTDLIAQKGAGATLPFPAFITIVAAFSVWFAGAASARGWLR